MAKFKEKYGFILNLVNKTNTDNFPHNLYRVRLVDKKRKIEDITQLSYPKTNVSLGRCNFANDPTFYCSDKSTTAIAEIFKYQDPSNKYLYLSVWKFNAGNELTIFALLSKALKKGLISEKRKLKIIPNKEQRLPAERQLEEMEKLFYDDNHLHSATMSNMLFDSKIFPCDCIFYPSVISNELGTNISIKAKYFDENVSFQRAYIFEVTGNPENYNTLLLKFTLGQSHNIKWYDATSECLLIRTLLNTDLHIQEP